MEYHKQSHEKKSQTKLLQVIKLSSTYFFKQKGRPKISILADLGLRIIGVAIYPATYLLLLCVSLFYPVKVGFLYRERLGHLALNTDLYLRRRHLGLIDRKGLSIFFVYKPSNRQLVNMFSRVMLVVNSEFLSKILSPLSIFKSRFYIPLPFEGNEYLEFNATPPQITFTDDEKRKGRAFLKTLGISEADWYVCIFSRDHAYYRLSSPNTDVSFSEHRNADIDTFESAVKLVAENGGWIFRMGSHVEKPLGFQHPRLVDYAVNNRDDFLDIYITAHAKFFVGTTSGASDLAVVFNVPFVGVNYVPVGCAPIGKDSIYIPKRIIDNNSGDQVPMRKQFDSFPGNQVNAAIIPEDVLKENHWSFRDNTSEEIRDAVAEMLERLDGRFVSDDAYMLTCARYDQIRPKDNFHRPNKSPIARSMLYSLNLSANDKEKTNE